MSPLLALSGHALVHCECPLLMLWTAPPPAPYRLGRDAPLEIQLMRESLNFRQSCFHNFQSSPVTSLPIFVTFGTASVDLNYSPA
jgi:hypothetical protein